MWNLKATGELEPPLPPRWHYHPVNRQFFVDRGLRSGGIAEFFRLDLAQGTPYGLSARLIFAKQSWPRRSLLDRRHRC
jgi:hypothetical protein